MVRNREVYEHLARAAAIADQAAYEAHRQLEAVGQLISEGHKYLKQYRDDLVNVAKRHVCQESDCPLATWEGEN